MSTNFGTEFTEQNILNRAKNATYETLDVTPMVETGVGVSVPLGYQAPLPAKIINTDGTDNSYTTGGVYGQKVHVVGISDIYAEGTIAAGSSLTGHKPVATGFKDASGNSQFDIGDTTNGRGVKVNAIAAGSSVIGKVGIDQTTPTTTNGVQILNSLVKVQYDYISLGYTGANLTTVVYKTGGSGGTTVATLTLAYTGAVLDSITKS